MNRLYIYEAAHAPGELKIGETDRDDVHVRIREQLGTANVRYSLLHQQVAVRRDGTTFRDTDVHNTLERMGHPPVPRHMGGKDTEWYRVDLATALTAIASVETGRELDAGRWQTFGMRPEQQSAVRGTSTYFREHNHDDGPAHFLWNAKMRFGKTFTTYQLALEMGWTRLLVLTYKPAVADAWRKDLQGHVDFAGWQFVDKDTDWETLDESRPIVWFASFQDVLGKTKDKKIKERNWFLHAEDWDCIAIDEYHFGAWRDNAKDLYSQTFGDEKDEKQVAEQSPDADAVESLPIAAKHYLYLSGTPFRAIETGEFSEEQIFNWTYPDEQAAKEAWPAGAANPYADLPRMELRTYLIGDTARSEATEGEFNEFSLSELFKATKSADGTYAFTEERYVTAWLDTITGRNAALLNGELRQRTLTPREDGSGPQFPYADANLRNLLRHTVWYLPDVAACRAMTRLLNRDPYFGGDPADPHYRVVDIGGSAAGTGIAALDPVRKTIDEANKPTITLSCGKLMTGVTVPEWTGIFMLRGTNSPESYFQAAFRVQSPWTSRDADQPGGRQILKDTCYVFDFDPQRALRLVGEFATRVSEATGASAESKVKEFTAFLPVFCYADGQMQAVDAADILAIADSGLTSSMMVRKWKSANLVQLDGPTFHRLLADEELMETLNNLEQFRNNKVDVGKAAKVVISAEEALRKAKAERRAPTEEEDSEAKEARKQKQQLREALVAFLQRIPAFMYITDTREKALVEVIRAQEGAKFERATGVPLAMFERLVQSGLLRNDNIDKAILAFKRYEDSSLGYAGNFKDRSDLSIGAMFDTLTTEQADRLINQRGPKS